MRIKEVGYIVERLADRFRDLGGQMADQEAAHKAALTEIRASFNARTGADEKIIEGLRIQVQDMRAEMERLRGDERKAYQAGDALRAEVTALERLRASIARGDFAQMEVAALKSQTPKQHGRWVRATSEKCMHAKAGEVVSVRGYLVRTKSGEFLWEGKDCEPCGPPIVTREPTIGDTVRLVKIPTIGAVSPELQKALEWPWIERWGTLNQTALVVEPAYQLDGTLSVCLSTNVHARWPISCVEVVTEATHDTEAGKAAAESAVKTEPVTEEIKVGDLGEVFQATTRTLNSDVGITGCVSSIHLDPCHGGFLVKFDPSTQSRRSAGMQAFGLCDVRKVPT